MNAINFDTRAIALRYKEAGFTEAQVEAMVKTAPDSFNLPNLSHLATKADLVELRAEVKSESAGIWRQIAEAKVQFMLTTLAAVGFADGLLLFLLRR